MQILQFLLVNYFLARTDAGSFLPTSLAQLLPITFRKLPKSSQRLDLGKWSDSEHFPATCCYRLGLGDCLYPQSTLNFPTSFIKASMLNLFSLVNSFTLLTETVTCSAPVAISFIPLVIS